ncbi:MAG: nitrate ABC transporter permease, partial [bacterium]|nr:nitrate ABC transporter permease [bacterium]
GDLWMIHGLSRELWTSFVLNIQALAIATVITLALAYSTVLPVMRPIVAALSKLRFLGLVGLTFAFTVAVGGGRPLKLSLLVFGITAFFITAMADVVASIPRDRFDHARTLRMKEWRVVWEVVVLGTRDKAVEMLRQNAAIGWMMLTMVEGISRAEGGIGALLLNQNKHFHLAAVFAAQITILMVGIAMDYAIGMLQRIVAPYAFLSLERR